MHAAEAYGRIAPSAESYGIILELVLWSFTLMVSVGAMRRSLETRFVFIFLGLYC